MRALPELPLWRGAGARQNGTRSWGNLNRVHSRALLKLSPRCPKAQRGLSARACVPCSRSYRRGVSRETPLLLACRLPGRCAAAQVERARHQVPLAVATVQFVLRDGVSAVIHAVRTDAVK